MNIEPNAIETYQSTTTLLLAYKLAEKRYPLRKTSFKNKRWNQGQIERIAEKIRDTARRLASETKDPELYNTLMSIIKHKDHQKVVQTLTLTHNTMLRDNML